MKGSYLWLQPNNSRHTDQFDIGEVVPMLPSPFHTDIDEIGHALEESASRLQLDSISGEGASERNSRKTSTTGIKGQVQLTSASGSGA